MLWSRALPLGRYWNEGRVVIWTQGWGSGIGEAKRLGEGRVGTFGIDELGHRSF